MNRSVPLYVNKKSGVAHLNRDCDALELVPDGALRIAHVQCSALPPLRYCRCCIPSSLPTWERLCTDDGARQGRSAADPGGVDGVPASVLPFSHVGREARAVR